MTEEIKLRVGNISEVEEKLEQDGEKLQEKKLVDTYFRTECDSVLKLRESSSGNLVIRYQPTEQGFEKVLDKKVEKPKEIKTELKDENGIKSILDKEMKFYSWKEFTVIINRIKNLGEFLIIEGDEKPDKELVFEKLNLKNPGIIKVPFSDLTKQ